MDQAEDNEEYDMYDEWKNELLRESVAKSSLIKVRRIHSSTYFTKGKLNDLGYFLKDNEDINVVFINSTLTALQQKKLEKRWNDIILSREDRLRRYYLKSAQTERFNPTDIDSESSQMSELEAAPQN
jgi:50S ribosomal subunit-associated GTPase HflX